MSSMNPADTATWLPLDGLAPGFDANKAPHSTDLAGRTLTLVDERGTRIRHTFTENRVEWDYSPGTGDPIEASASSDDYECFAVADGLYFAQFHHQDKSDEAVSLVIDLTAGRALAVVQVILPEAAAVDGQTRVHQIFAPSIIEELTTSGDAAAPSTSLIGRRVQWTYSTEHAYEHIYLSPRWYTWQCLAGPERGLADTDQNDAWQVRPGIFIFAWREKVIPCASVTIADHRDARNIRSHGVLFGLDESGESETHFTFGAYGRLISVTVHPDEYDPTVIA